MTILTNDVFIKRHLSGIQLLLPEESELNNANPLTEMLNVPVSVILLDNNSKIKWINNQNATTLGFDSTEAALGKTIKSAYKEKSAAFSLQHDLDVLQTRKHIIKEEACERVDDRDFYAITAKMPWYDQHDNIIGLIGYSIAVGLDPIHSMQYALQTFAKLNGFVQTPADISVINHDDIYFTRRETDLIMYIVKGKTAKEIGALMSLSRRTVEFYIENIKNKIGVNKKSQLIEYCINYLNRRVPDNENRYQ